jgi:hypothetical protein
VDRLDISEVASLLRDQQAPQTEAPVSLSKATTNSPATVTPEGQGKRSRRMRREEANDKAKKLAEVDHSFVQRSLREWSEAIGCSEGLVTELSLWRETMKRTGRGKEDATSAPKVVSLTPQLEAVTGEGEKDEELNRLIAEQEADHDPSPLDDDTEGRPRRVHSRKRL